MKNIKTQTKVSDFKKRLNREMDTNYDYFLERRNELIKKHKGEFVLIRQQQFVDFFDTYEQAIMYGEKTYKDGMFSVQEVTDKVITIV